MNNKKRLSDTVTLLEQHLLPSLLNRLSSLNGVSYTKKVIRRKMKASLDERGYLTISELHFLLNINNLENVLGESVVEGKNLLDHFKGEYVSSCCNSKRKSNSILDVKLIDYLFKMEIIL